MILLKKEIYENELNEISEIILKEYEGICKNLHFSNVNVNAV